MAQGGGTFVKFRAHEVLLHRRVAKPPFLTGEQCVLNPYHTRSHLPHTDIMQNSPVPK